MVAVERPEAEELEALDAYSRVVSTVAERLIPSVARISRDGKTIDLGLTPVELGD